MAQDKGTAGAPLLVPLETLGRYRCSCWWRLTLVVRSLCTVTQLTIYKIWLEGKGEGTTRSVNK
eukprot:1026032-Prorocentrum_minimum.AAC.1